MATKGSVKASKNFPAPVESRATALAEREGPMTIERAQKMLASYEKGIVSAFDLPVIKLPLTGSTRFEDGSEEKTGVIIHIQPRRVFWGDQQVSANAQPFCTSFDTETGGSFLPEAESVKHMERLGATWGGECASCPMNEWASQGTVRGNESQGKACREVRLVYIMTSDRAVLPSILRIPATSLRAWRKYQVSAAAGGFAFWELKTRIRILPATSKGSGQAFNQYSFQYEPLSNDECAYWARFGDLILPYITSEAHMRSQAAMVTPNDSYETAAASPAAVNEPDAVPF